MEVAVGYICISGTEQVNVLGLIRFFSFQGSLMCKIYSKTMKSAVLENDNKG